MSIPINDVDDPNWAPSFETDPVATIYGDGHSSHGIITIHGIMDLMHHLKEESVEEVRAWMEAGEREEELPEWLRAVLPIPDPKPVHVVANILPARSFHTATYLIPVAGNPIPVSTRVDRLRIVLTNLGANPAYFSFTDDADNINTAGMDAWAAVPNGAVPGNPRELRAGGKVYMYSPLGTQVDIQEEYGYRNLRGGSVNP